LLRDRGCDILLPGWECDTLQGAVMGDMEHIWKNFLCNCLLITYNKALIVLICVFPLTHFVVVVDLDILVTDSRVLNLKRNSKP